MNIASFALILSIIFPVLILGSNLEYKEIFESCIASENATNEDLETVLSGILPETETEKCLSACLSEKFGTIVDNHLTYTGLKNLIENVKDKVKTVETVDQMYEKCRTITDSNRCEAASKIHTCLYEFFNYC